MICILKKRNKAFTLIELVIIISIIGILVLLATPKFIAHTKEAKLAQIKHDVKAVETVIDEYLIRNKALPEDLSVFDYSKSLEENKVYGKTGLITQLEGEFLDVTDMKEVKAINSKLKGNFIANNNGDVYYVATERIIEVDGGDENGNGESNEENGVFIPNEWLNEDYPKIAVAEKKTFLVFEDGVYGFGYNGNGELGLGDTTTRTTPTKIYNLTDKDIVKILGGAYNTYAISRNGDVYVFGWNVNGQLALGHTMKQFTPVKSLALSNFNSKNIKIGLYHGLLLENGKLYSWGKNDSGELGVGDIQHSTMPTEVSLFSNVYEKPKNIYVTAYSSFFVGENEIYGFGNNTYGQLGLGNNEITRLPSTIDALKDKDIMQILGGLEHSYAISRNGDVYTFGRNSSGQLGLGDTSNRLTPVKNNTLSGFSSKNIKTSGQHSLIVENGKLYSWGLNNYGQLGLGDTTNRLTPTEVSLFSNVYERPKNIYVTADSSFFVGENEIYGFGDNTYGQLGLGDTFNRLVPTKLDELKDKGIIKILGGLDHIYAVSQNGDVYVLGRNDSGQLGLGDTLNRLTPVKNNTLSGFNSKNIKTVGSHSLLLENGKLYAWGLNDSGQLGLGDAINRNTPTEVSFFSNNNITIKDVYAGYYTSFATTTDNKLYVWGKNDYGQLGLGHGIAQSTPVELIFFRGIPIKDIKHNGNSTFVLTEDGKVYSFGYNGHRQLGIGTDDLYKLTPQLVNVGGKAVDKIMTGGQSTIAITQDGYFYGWGYSYYGETGFFGTQKSPIRLTLIENLDPVDIQMGSSYTIVKTKTGDIYVWGLNSSGQLGLGHTQGVTNPFKPYYFDKITIKDAWAGHYHSFATTTDNKLYVWGRNDYGQLGLGDKTGQVVPVELDFFRGVPIKDIKTNETSTFILTENGKLYSFGLNYRGQLGLGHTNDRITPQLVNVGGKAVKKIMTGIDSTIAIATDDTIYGWGYSPYGELGFSSSGEKTSPIRLTEIENLNPVDIQMGYDHTIIKTSTGDIYVSGLSGAGQLGLGLANVKYTPFKLYYFDKITIKDVFAGHYHSFATTTDNKLYVWGRNDYGQLGLGNKTNQTIPIELDFFRGVPIKDIKTNYISTFILTEDGKLYSFGYNGNGQLGLGHKNDRITPQLVNIDGKAVDKIITGSNSTIAITKDGSIYGWGYNSYDELGVSREKTSPVRLTVIESLNPVDIQIGDRYTVLKTKTGDIYVWGLNDYGQLGLGDTTKRPTPVKLNLDFLNN